MVYNGYYEVMSNIPKMGRLPTPVYMLDFQLPCLISLWVGHSLHASAHEQSAFCWVWWELSWLEISADGGHATRYGLKPMGPIFWWMNIHLSDVLGVHERKKDKTCFDFWYVLTWAIPIASYCNHVDQLVFELFGMSQPRSDPAICKHFLKGQGTTVAIQ